MVDENIFSMFRSIALLLVNSLIRRRLNNLSSAISNRLWLNAHTNYECDVLLTFPTRVDDYGLVWFLEQLLQLAPDIRISIKYHFTTGEDIFFVLIRKHVKTSFCFCWNRCLWILCDIYLQKVNIYLRIIGLRGVILTGQDSTSVF